MNALMTAWELEDDDPSVVGESLRCAALCAIEGHRVAELYWQGLKNSADQPSLLAHIIAQSTNECVLAGFCQVIEMYLGDYADLRDALLDES